MQFLPVTAGKRSSCQCGIVSVVLCVGMDCCVAVLSLYMFTLPSINRFVACVVVVHLVEVVDRPTALGESESIEE